MATKKSKRPKKHTRPTRTAATQRHKAGSDLKPAEPFEPTKPVISKKRRLKANSAFKSHEQASVRLVRSIKRIIRSTKFGKYYAIGAVLILAVSVTFWSALSARLNQANADQLVNSYLFESGNTFKQAIFPGQHSFLLKWPLFWIISLFGFSKTAFISMTVAVVLATVAVLVGLLYRLERRPLYFGTICLALASALLLVPAQPYAGGLLPVNMAMVTTRNLEYALFLALLVWVTRLKRLRSWHFLGLIAGLTILFASDRLFIALAFGGAVLGYLMLILARRWRSSKSSLLWLVVCLVAAIASAALIGALDSTRVTSLLSQQVAGPGSGGTSVAASPTSSILGPYGAVFHIHNLILGGFYAAAGLFTNLGANPAFDATIFRDIPHTALQRLRTLAGPAYLINIVVLLAGLVAAGQLIRRAFSRNTSGDKDSGNMPTQPQSIALSLVWSSLAATGAFVLTDHQYPVDARYLGIWLFALFVCIAAYSQTRIWRQWHIVATGLILLVAIGCGSWGSLHNIHSQQAALSSVTNRNQKVVQALSQHHTNLLIGDYWRVIPAKALATSNTPANKLTVMPLQDCIHPRAVLTSRAWQPNLAHQSFAYLLSTTKGLTDFPKCNLQQIVQTYGRPSSSIVIEGDIANPSEILLFYDHGTNRPGPRYDMVSKITAGVLPIPLNKLSTAQTNCGGQPTVMNIVAHEDDDLLFMNPDLSHDLAAKHCVRTVYLTAGDAGSDAFYWLSRERGSEAAYDVMDGPEPDQWNQRIVQIDDTDKSDPGGQPGKATSQKRGHYVTIATPRRDPSISLIFFHLPDGGLTGNGFARSHYESLSRLEANSIGRLQTVDGQTSYSIDSLSATLAALMQAYQPAEVRTQADYTDATYPDHSDHRATSRIATRAHQLYTSRLVPPTTHPTLKHYLGYPVRNLPENIEGADLNTKELAFFAYGKLDPGVCKSVEDCATVVTYNSYLHRQYPL